MMNISQKHAAVTQDLKLAYIEQGDPCGPAVIFIPGYSDTCRSYQPLLEQFSADYRLIALSQRGHGDSDKPADGYSMRQFAADLAAFMDHLDIASAFVVGHSLGSLTAMRFAIDQPLRTLGLGLLGAFKTLAGNPLAQELWDDVIANTSANIDPLFVRAFQESTLFRPIPPAQLEAAIAESQKMPGPVWKSVLRHQLDEDFSHQLADIKAPTLIVWSEEDIYCTRDDQEFLATAICHAQFVAIKQAGHALHWEDPAYIARLLTDFFAPYRADLSRRATGVVTTNSNP